MTQLKNSAYKSKVDVVASTVGLNLEKGAIVYSEADAGYMFCDGTAWIAGGGGGGGVEAGLYARNTTSQSFNIIVASTSEPIKFAEGPGDFDYNWGGVFSYKNQTELDLPAGKYLIALNWTMLIASGGGVPGQAIAVAWVEVGGSSEGVVATFNNGEIPAPALNFHTAGGTALYDISSPKTIALEIQALGVPVQLQVANVATSILKVG